MPVARRWQGKVMVVRRTLLLRLVAFAIVLSSCVTVGCSHRSPPGAASGPVNVTVSLPIRRNVTDYAEYTGMTAAVDMVQVRARVSGYLEKINFKDGSEVTEGAVLFEIDPRPYEDQLHLNEAQLAANQASYRLAELNFERAAALLKEKGISQQEYDQDKAARDQAAAQVKSAEASTAQARLNLSWTNVHAPIDGQLSRTFITRGNLVTADATVLTTIASQDPMYAYFDIDEPTVLRVRKLIREGEFQTSEGASRWPVFLGLANEEGYSHEGYVDFSNNQFTPGTATLQVRGVFANPKPRIGRRLLAPGMFARIRVPVSPPHPALLVSQDAIGTNQNVKSLYVVNADNNVETRDVTLGNEHNGLQEITKGIRPDDHVIISGIQHVHPGIAVEPKLVPMPVPPKGRQSSTPPNVTPLPKAPRRK